MKDKMINTMHVEGILYDHSLEMKVTGKNSKNPGTPYITGSVSVATDDEKTNVVPVYFRYVTEIYGKSGKPNPNFAILKNIIDGVMGTHMNGCGSFVRIDGNIALKEWYSDRNGSLPEPELVSTKRFEGNFIHSVDAIAENEKDRNRFDTDILITGVFHIDADEEKQTVEKCRIKGCLFDDYRKSMLPVEFSATNPLAIDYFEGLGASEGNPIFTRVKGKQLSETIVKTTTEEGAFGEPQVREVKSSRKDFIVHWAQPVPYDFGDDAALTGEELKKMISDREIYLATLKQRVSAPATGAFGATPAASAGEFKF